MSARPDCYPPLAFSTDRCPARGTGWTPALPGRSCRRSLAACKRGDVTTRIDIPKPVIVGRVPWRARVLPAAPPCMFLALSLFDHTPPFSVAVFVGVLVLNVAAAVAWPGTRMSVHGIRPVGRLARIRWQAVDSTSFDGQAAARRGAVVIRRTEGRRRVHLTWTRPADLQRIADYGNSLVARTTDGAGQSGHA